MASHWRTPAISGANRAAQSGLWVAGALLIGLTIGVAIMMSNRAGASMHRQDAAATAQGDFSVPARDAPPAVAAARSSRPPSDPPAPSEARSDGARSAPLPSEANPPTDRAQYSGSRAPSIQPGPESASTSAAR